MRAKRWTIVAALSLIGAIGLALLVHRDSRPARQDILPPAPQTFRAVAPQISAQDQATIDNWSQMEVTPLTNRTAINELVDKIPLTADGSVSAEAISALKDSLRAFLTYASSNDFETYSRFRGVTPEVKYKLDERLDDQLRTMYPKEPLDTDGQIPLARFFELSSFGTDGRKANFWHFDAAALTNGAINVLVTNQVPDSIAKPFADAEFQSGGYAVTNNKFVWPHSKQGILAQDKRLTVAVVKVYLQMDAQEPPHPFPIFIGFFWDPVDRRWMPDELQARNAFRGVKPLFF